MKLFILKNFRKGVIEKGFTLIETLVAITVLMLSVTGPLVISQKGLSAAGYAKDQITAYYLAQDAMEYVRNVRDTNILTGITSGSGKDWLSVVSGRLSPCNVASCKIDTRPSGGDVSGCSGSACLLTKNDTGNSVVQYGHDTGTYTPFGRTVKIERPDGSVTPLGLGDIEAKVIVIVSWPTLSGQTKNITLVENLFKQN